jgi:hypothetical protein
MLWKTFQLHQVLSLVSVSEEAAANRGQWRSFYDGGLAWLNGMGSTCFPSTSFLKLILKLRDPNALLDESTHIFVTLAGRPDGNDYDACAKRATDAMLLAAHEGWGTWTKKQTTENARGDFPALTGGIGMGGGHTVTSCAILLTQFLTLNFRRLVSYIFQGGTRKSFMI